MIEVGLDSMGALVIQCSGYDAVGEARRLAHALIRCTPTGEYTYQSIDAQSIVVCVTSQGPSDATETTSD
jgi:hypothetical protein